MILPIIIPFVVLIFVGFSIGAIISCVVFVLIGSYFVRLFLWNWRGKETLEINDKEIIQTLDYVYFNEQNRIPNKTATLIIHQGNTQIEIPKILDDGWTNKNEQANISFTSEQETIELHSQVSQTNIKQIIELLNKQG